MTGPCVQGWVDGTGPSSLPLPGPLHLMPLVSRLPSFSVSRFGRPSDHHHHRLPHHGNSCSDYNSCLKKLVRTLGPSGWVTGVSGGPWGSTHREVLASQLHLSSQPRESFLCLGWRVPRSSCPAQPAPLCPGYLAARWQALFPDHGFLCGTQAQPAWLNCLGRR